MKKFIFISHLLFQFSLCLKSDALEKLPNSYLVQLGSENAPLKIVQFYSLLCPHCITFFRKEFEQIRHLFIDTNQVQWTFHPVPSDKLTVQAMMCLEKLSDHEKKIFLEVIFEEALIEDPKLSADLMQKAMEIFKKSIANLNDSESIKNSKALQDSFLFIKQEEQIDALPSVEVNGKLFVGEIPDSKFVAQKLKEAGK